MSFQALEITERGTNALYVDSITVTDSLDDSDGDGLPDSWEEQYWPGDLSRNPGDLSANGSDTVWQCYVAGLDPTDPDAEFLISVLRSPSSVLSWNSTSGRVYTIYWTSNLLSGFQTLETNFTGGILTDVTHSAEDKGFYKIDVELDD